MKHALLAFRRYFRRSSQSGQSVVLLALGFIALAGFVGITTDISLMFVRYAQLSRAVDSAAIAAANQMRQDRSNASVQLAARQFIEFYGISPESVIVDTCLTTNDKDKDLCNDEQAKLVRVRAYFRQPTVFLRLVGVQWFDMWVAATSQTAALDVVIVMDVSESMAKDTTIQDWAVAETVPAVPGGPKLGTKNWGVVYRPPHASDILAIKVPWDPFTGPETEKKFWTVGLPGIYPKALLQYPQAEVSSWLTYYRPSAQNTPEDVNGIGKGGGNFPEFRTYYNDMFFYDGNPDAPPAPAGTSYGPGPSKRPRAECTVRFYPSAITVKTAAFRGAKNAAGQNISYGQILNSAKLNGPLKEVRALDTLTDKGADGQTNYYLQFDGFMPTYNYYGCCNDPDHENGFDDLVCQPFKQIRQATFGFLDRIDFIRGDRAAFVTYDRTAFLVNPFKYRGDPLADPLPPKDESKRPGAMLDSKTSAYSTLRNLIGVRAEPYFYVMTEPGFAKKPEEEIVTLWPEQAAGLKDGSSIEVDYNDISIYKPTDPKYLASINYPVRDNCFVQNAGQSATRSLFPGALERASLPTERDLPTGYDPNGLGYNTLWKDFNNNQNDPQSAEYKNTTGENVITWSNPAAPAVGERIAYQQDVSYEGWAACRSGNIGAALREANNALLNPNTSRRFGTIWIIVLMSDGGAGASDPVRRNGDLPVPAQLYEDVPVGSQVYGKLGEYGAYGLCPMGVPTTDKKEAGELVMYGNDSLDPDFGDIEAGLPYCADEKPETRHTCDFRPLLTLPNHPARDNYKNAGRGALWDNNFLKPGTPQPNGTAGPAQGSTDAEVEAWNKLRDHLYDVDIAQTPKPFDVTVPLPNGGSAVYSLARGGCDPLYDVEDYARDWADYIAIANLGSTSSNVQVPTIFTIGFALRFGRDEDIQDKTFMYPNGTPLTNTALEVNDPLNATLAQKNVKRLCELNVQNCLGEQLLRYIADIGDNNRIDNDYYQDMMYEWYRFEKGFNPGVDLIPDGYLGSPLPASFGSRDACQYTDPNNAFSKPISNTYDNGAGLPASNTAGDRILSTDELKNELGQLRANISCGNYYYSPSADQLQFVFDDIASRMFTRLSR